MAVVMSHALGSERQVARTTKFALKRPEGPEKALVGYILSWATFLDAIDKPVKDSVGYGFTRQWKGVRKVCVGVWAE